ncbi:GNAT family N-acetyltransferase [Cronobacter dublinensis]|uniref:GNAT family N-acetyltransferase n=1 Tax=Cronobacter dublinensis TaxID=413497 RepID=UPI000CFB8866|nr:GNAT family N-acetyltransferase [Cronobacter dublinensis]EGT4507656.1 GNAT family N-acetyltransferase [Cronobacter sakazakii]ELY2620442.1 GNAT family N-acetyltransferase [Cronobacter malonaticus]EIZ8991273.1 GNAT family N-acetyltransferase [Cronobacter sakazakii]EKK3979596.1 GNAT family N-acetyltransferase [Cronobacter sakazakii]EKK3999895.1 GNAT family N-acetyltransferase [Cronobacter sakazakii]
MEIVVCGAKDVPDLVTLFVEMEDYYFGCGAVSHEEMSAYLADKVFSAYSGVTVIGARKNGVFVGFATFTLMFPAPLCSGQAFMKELFTSEMARGQGIGKSLIRFIANFALKQGCSRLDWTTDTSNPKAGMFYLSLGATLIEEKQYFRLEGKDLETFSLSIE